MQDIYIHTGLDHAQEHAEEESKSPTESVTIPDHKMEGNTAQDEELGTNPVEQETVQRALKVFEKPNVPPLITTVTKFMASHRPSGGFQSMVVSSLV